MNDDKLKKLEEFCGRFSALMISGQYCERDGKIKDSDDYDYVEDILPDLIKHCRQLEKDKQRLQKANDELFGQMTEESDRADKAEEAQAELLAALKPLVQKLKRPTADAIIHAHQVYNKHKGE